MIMVIIAGAIMTYFMGKISDVAATHFSYSLPFICFIIVIIYAVAYPK